MTKNEPKQWAERVGSLKLMLGLALRRGDSIADRARLLYYGIKPSLVYRGWSRYLPERRFCFGARIGDRVFRVHARDNGADMEAFAEFFSARYQILPPELPPLEPQVVYDLGANIGMASLYFASHFPRAQFYGFEPDPGNVEVCTLNYQNLPGSRLLPWAVGGKTGRMRFALSGDPRGGQLGAGTHGQTRSVEVPTYTIADLVATQGLPAPELLKVDVEGAELEVLHGLGDQCRSVKRLLIETHGEAVKRECLKWLLDHDFVVRHIHEATPGFAAVWCDR